MGELNIHSGTINATGGDSASGSGSPALYAYLDDLSISGGTITAKGGNGAVNGSHGIYTQCGTVTIGSGANVTAIAGNGTTGLGGVGIRAYGSPGGTGTSPGAIQIAANAGDIYVRGGQGVSAQRDSIIARSIYVATGNIGSISMESGASHLIQNVPGGDDLYLVKAAVNPAAKVVIKSSVVGSKGDYLYRAPTKEDGLASLWLPSGEKTLMAEDYDAGTLTVPVGGSPVPEITLSLSDKDPVVTAHNTAELKTYMAVSYVTTINLVEGTVYDYDGASITRALTINGNGATINAGAGIDGIVVKMTDGKVPNATGKVFLEVQGVGSSLTLKDVTVQSGNTLFLCGVNAKTGATVSLEDVTFKGFHANIASEGIVNNFGVHAEPEAVALTVKDCLFDSSNAFRNAVAVRGGTALIENSTFIGTATPELLNVSDGYEYGVYLYGGTSTVTNNTMSGYDGALIPGYLSSPIATAAYYDIEAEITGNKLSDSTVGINLVGAWHTLSYPCKATVNGIALNSSENAYLLGEKLAAQNTMTNNPEGSIQLNLDQNDYYTDTKASDPENFGTPAYFGGLLKLKDNNSASATLEFLDSKTAKAAIANQKSIVLQVSEDNGANWTSAAVTAPLTSNSTGAAVSLASGKNYLLRAVMTITSQTMPHGSLPDVYTPADIVCYSNAVSVAIAAGGSSSGGKKSTTATNSGAEVIVNGKIQNAGSAETVKGSDGRTTTTVTVDSAKLETILAAEKKGATVVIPVTGGADTAAGKLTGEMIKNMENQEATLVVKTDAASYTIPASQINISDVSRQLGTSVSLADIAVVVSVSEPDKTMAKVVNSAASNGGYTIMVPAVDFTITCAYGGRTVNVSGFNSYVERTIAIPDGVDPKKITTGVVVDPKGTIHHVPTRVTVINGTYYAVINSLTNSTYSVIWNPVEFADVKKHWAKDSVNNMGSRMVVTGVGSTNYAPARNLTRGEFAAILVRALGLEPGIGSRKFGDVTATDWYSGYIKTAAEYGIITGYDNGNFGPEDTITREQAMAMIARTMKITGLNSDLTTGEAGQLLKGFADAAKVSAYARDSIEACLKTGIVTGISADKLSPKTHITRAEAAVMAERLLQKSNLI
ncbi:MAG: putative surface layer protein [Bacillota bacterium]|nr:putative surface layer protein [Bacillota bacterium]